MAKKTKKKARRAARKPRRAAPARRSSNGPVAVTTGRGLTPAEIGADLVALFNRGQFKDVEDKHWAPAIESIEGVGVAQAWRGKRAVEGKNAWWAQDHEMQGGSAEGPYVGATGFAVKFRLDVLTKSTGQRQMMEEVGVYTVKNGKIIREEFMYGTSPGASA